MLDGLARAGYRLVYAETPNAAWNSYEADLGAMDLSLSLGLAIGKKGAVKTVAWEGPAFKAGISLGAHLTSVNGQDYTDERLKEALLARQPIVLGYEADGAARTATIGYTGSLRYPRLERIPGTGDRLTRLLNTIPAPRP